MEEKQITDNRYLRVFCYIVLMELFLMGSGQLLPVAGFLTMRMVNYLIAVTISIFFVIRSDDFPKAILWSLLLFTGVLVFSFFWALMMGSENEAIMDDIKPLIYFYIILFYYYVLSTGIQTTSFGWQNYDDILSVLSVSDRCDGDRQL